jgi:type I restriction enzyme, S subunit
MKDWKEIYFNDFIKLNRGFDLTNSQLVEGDFPVVNSTEIKFYHKNYKVNGPGVITGRSGSLGTVQYVEGKYWPHNTTLYVKDFKRNHPKFVYYFLQIMHLENFNSGAGVPTLNQNHLHKQKIIVPIPATQQRIASILSAYDDLIEVNNQRIKLLEQTARELYKEWFVRMRFPGYKQAKFKKGIPDKWEPQTLDELGKIFTGKTPSTKIPEYYGGDIPFIKTPDLHRSLFVFETEERLTEKGNNTQKRSTLPANSICVSCIGTGGIVAITTAEKSQTNQQINSLIPTNKKQLEFLYHRIVDLKETIELFGGTGATMTNLSKGKFEKLKILFPENGLIEKYHFLVNPMFEQIKLLQQQNTQLRQIRDRLLPRLISGKLQVKTPSEKSVSV